MGLAASQARLLTLTARLSDLELQAQKISNEKIRLSQDSERASLDYSDALSKQKLTYKTVDSNGETSYAELNANMLVNYDPTSLESQRLLKDSYGRILEDQKTANNYQASGGNLETFLNKFGYTQYAPAQLESTYLSNFTTNTISQVQNDENTILNSISSTTTSNSVVTTTTTETTTYTRTAADNAFIAQLQNDFSNALDLAQQSSIEFREAATPQPESVNEVTDAITTVKDDLVNNGISYGLAILNSASYNASVGKYITAYDMLSSYDINGAVSKVGTANVTTNVGETTTVNSTTTYSSTMTKDNMKTALNALASDLSGITNTCTSSDLTAFLSAVSTKLNSVTTELDADSSVSSNTAKDIVAGISSIDLTKLASLLSASSLTTTGKTSADGTFKNDTAAVKYYTNVFEAMGGGSSNTYITAPASDLSDNTWLHDQLTNGTLSLYKFNSDAGTDGKGAFVSESISTDTSMVLSTDDNQTAKAEADYEAKTAEIETKDKRLDLELNNINTEHSSIQTEMDSVSKVIQKNVERTFKTFNA